MPKLAQRFHALPGYPLAHVPQRKRELIASGVDVIDLGAGDADLPPPRAAIEALTKAADQPAMHRYGFGLGYVPYREAVAGFMRDRFGLAFDPLKEIVPLIGSKEGIAHVALAYLDPGEVAIIPEPGYTPYVGGTALSEGQICKVPLRAEQGFLLDVREVPAELARRARILYLNYPNNPTAAVASREYLADVVRWCRERDVLLVYDNAYSELAYDGYVPPSIFEIEGARDVAVEFHSLSKTFNMTGWRLGWAAANPEICAALAKVKLFVDTGAFMGLQAAGAAALGAWREFIPQNVAQFQARRDAAVYAFRQAGFSCEVPRATMYLWVRLPDGLPSAAFADRLLEDAGVVVLPGSGFGPGGEGFFRVSFICSPARITEAAVRAGRVLAELSQVAA